MTKPTDVQKAGNRGLYRRPLPKPVNGKERLKNKNAISRHVREFLEGGGKIEVLPSFADSDPK